MGDADSAVLGRGVRLGGDRYRLERVLGRGGMAAVWLAHDEVLARPVAVKVLSDSIAADPEYLARFQREAQVAARLAHPNLVNVFDFSGTGERPYLVMEYVKGGNLADRLASGMRIERGRIARELLGALAHIHGAGVLHRDVKPQNVLIGEDGRSRLTDFGIAQPHDATSLTQTGQVLGTARYIAPEVMAGQPASEGSDLYSLGVLLRECPLADGTPELEALIERLTAPDPDARPISATEAMTQLTGGGPTQRLHDFDTPATAVAAEPVAELPEQERSPEPPDTLRRSPRRGAEIDPRKAVGGLLAAGAIVALLVAMIGGGGDDGGGERASRANGGDAPAANANAGEGDGAGEVPSAPADSLSGAELNDQGKALIDAGRYDEAIPILERAVDALAQNPEDLTYAYALFNLGNALRLAGRSEEAIPILERRLEIPNQTEVVQRELDLARAAAGEGGDPPNKLKKPKSKDD